MAPRGRQVTCYGAAVLLAAALLLSAPDATGSTRSLPPPPSLSCLVLLEPREWQVDRRGRMARGARGRGGVMPNGRSPFGVRTRLAGQCGLAILLVGARALLAHSNKQTCFNTCALADYVLCRERTSPWNTGVHRQM